ncbi:GFA family protein [Pseudomonas neustonica]|uniref:GFA family protein n=1 Tax=Pseudomonas neustonica TaxID=2487346 RepID=A0ABX9XFF6_9PSED|nr:MULTISPECIES: GFA family protein [Pseudomonas]ROZ80017.1 GFA family protein [Pseudomonas sp. SSM44]ROZ80653.1 GFA family protein [Pseudomonas neustonica]|tara:strand:+ start:144 stop:539 length:396 start_codon:yes stop_codon:yes gene_type:complete
MHTGSCLCGAIRYRVNGPIGDIVHCHCVTCRKAHAAAFSSVAAVADSDFELQGADMLSHYRSSPDKARYFCASCGSQIYAKRDGTAHLVLRLGTLDDDPQSTERCHIWLSEKAPWYQLDQHLAEYDCAETG